MQIQTLLEKWSIRENPFSAEEARDDPVFLRLLDQGTSHPDFDKVLGQPDRPRAAVVFGEKGSGKTALRLMIERRIERYNAERTERLAWVVRYDDLNPFLDRLAHAHGTGRDVDRLLTKVRLADHMDAILSLATTRLMDVLLNEATAPTRGKPAKTARRMPRQKRIDLAELAALYDQPVHGNIAARWVRLRRMLRLGVIAWNRLGAWLGVAMILVAAGLAISHWIGSSDGLVMMLVSGVVAAAGLALAGVTGWRSLRLWTLARRVRRDMYAVERTTGQLSTALGQMPAAELAGQPLPEPGDADSRYQLIGRLLGVLQEFGYASIIVLVDRIDEPSFVAGDPKRMQKLIWPLFNNKFLQQDGVGVKLLLPIELRHLLSKEESPFFQQARLDKQHLIDRLNWSGTLLYDLCSRRLQACQPPDVEPIQLSDLFEEDVTERDVIDALDQMQQPRDAFKFVYAVLQEHCANVPEDKPQYRIPRLTLDSVRKQHSMRVQEFSRGLRPS